MIGKLIYYKKNQKKSKAIKKGFKQDMQNLLISSMAGGDPYSLKKNTLFWD